MVVSVHGAGEQIEAGNRSFRIWRHLHQKNGGWWLSHGAVCCQTDALTVPGRSGAAWPECPTKAYAGADLGLAQTPLASSQSLNDPDSWKPDHCRQRPYDDPGRNNKRECGGHERCMKLTSRGEFCSRQPDGPCKPIDQRFDLLLFDHQRRTNRDCIPDCPDDQAIGFG